MHLLVLHSDNRYQFKLLDLQNKSAEKYLNKDSFIDVEKFISWWMCSTTELSSFQI